MSGRESIFLAVELPNATTWFYFSLMLAVALFFKFSRLISMRNLDLVLVFLPVPGLLLLYESGGMGRWGFGWLLGVTVVLLLRCLFDQSLERRPALAPNLSPGGLAWLGVAFFCSLIFVAIDLPREDRAPEKKGPPLTEAVARQSEQRLDPLPITDTRLAATRALAVASHLAIVVALVLIGRQHFRDIHAGVAAATFYLLMPYTFMLMPYNGPLGGQWYHIWPTALILWAMVLYRRPTFAGLLLGIAAASVYYPILLVPLWLSFYRRNGGGRFLSAFVGGAAGCVLWLTVLAWIGGEFPHNFTSVWPMEVRDWLPWFSPVGDSPSFWRGVHWAYRMPVFLVFLAVLFTTLLWPAPKNLAHLIAQTAALLLGAQLWYADRGGMHVLWYLPLLLLMTFRPNLSSAQALPIAPESDWLRRVGRLMGRLVGWIIGPPSSQVPSQP